MGLKPRENSRRRPIPGDGQISNLAPLIEGAKEALTRGELDAAETDLRAALDMLGPMAGSISPLTAMAHGYLGHVSAQRGKAQKTLEHYKRAVKASPPHDKANIALYLDGQAGALSELGKTAEAIAMAEHALATAEDAFGHGAAELIHFTASLGFLHADAGAHQAVLKVLTQTVALCESHGLSDNLDSFYVELAIAKREQGDLRDSIEDYEKALTLSPSRETETSIHESLADLYQQVGTV